MNKSVFISLVFIFYLTACKQSAVKNRSIVDTDFISREVTKESYHAVYIEHNRQSESYDHLLDYKMDRYEIDDYNEVYKSIKKRSSHNLKVYDLSGLPKEWMPLYKYKGKYYIYSPSDWGLLGRRIITDSTMEFHYNSGIRMEPFIAVKKVDSQTYRFKLRSLWLNTGDAQITIHIIDPKNNIAVWEDSSNQTEPFQLYVARNKARNFDMIVNYCKENKTAEFIFDQIDFARLLKGHKQLLH